MPNTAAPLALLGGTFNPPHKGHIQPALQALAMLGLDRLGLMPCKLPPHKSTGGVGEQHRVNMVRLACESDARLYPELIELTLPEPSYSVKTLMALRSHLGPNRPICFFMGWDSLLNLPEWYEWQLLPELCHLVVMKRRTEQSQPDETVNQLLERRLSQDKKAMFSKPAGHIVLADTAEVPVSSTQLRQAITQGSEIRATNNIDPREWLTPPVFNYIKQHSLYS